MIAGVRAKKIMPILYSVVLVLFAANFLLGLNPVVNLVQSQFLSGNTAQMHSQGVEAGRVIPTPPISKGLMLPAVTAAGVYVSDLDTGYVFYVKDPDKRVPIASTTKVMTALVAAEYYQPNDVLQVYALPPYSGSNMGLKVGEKLTFRSLLYGMMLNSGNDAAYALAQNYPGGVSRFIEAMNEKVSQLGLANTHFDNPAGFDNPNHYSSAADLARIAAVTYANPQLARVVGTKQTEVASLDKTSVHVLHNLNKLLNIPGVLGIKTGFTPQAKENLIGLKETNKHKILTVVLGSDDRFGETEYLMNWVESNFSWQ
ncbi:D-alanyl-D-alanine carboxypeptidase [Candidatus Daviesbacteria bacterium]|nr:D-alanyl-D-alanine carboxypeptidase [Candidatus Daviesbacteria bacterium]